MAIEGSVHYDHSCIMSEHQEEQAMEAEALEAIFDQAFEVLNSEQPFKWAVKLVPIDCGGDREEEDAQNFVGIRLLATIPFDYPETLPELDVEIVKGLGDEHRTQLLDMANEESKNNHGMPAIFTICEVLREWLADNNVKGLDDASMHAQMMRRAKEDEQRKVRDSRCLFFGASILCVVHLHTLFVSRFVLFVRKAFGLLAIVIAWTRSRPRYRLFIDCRQGN